MNLTNVARSIQEELHKGYVEHLKRRHLREWKMGDPVFEEARKLRPQTLDAAAWVNQGNTPEERAANLGAIPFAQAHRLADRLMDREAQDFERDGGFSERLCAVRQVFARLPAGCRRKYPH